MELQPTPGERVFFALSGAFIGYKLYDLYCMIYDFRFPYESRVSILSFVHRDSMINIGAIFGLFAGDFYARNIMNRFI